MNNLLQMAANRAATYLENLDNRGVAPTPKALAHLTELDQPLPDTPTSAEDVLALLDDIGSPATVAAAGSRYFGFVIGGALPVTVAANWLATAWDQNAGLIVASPIAAALEAVARRWLLDILALP